MRSLPKVSVEDAGATTGSRVKVMCNLPGSVETEGLTGDEKLKTRRGGMTPAIEFGVDSAERIEEFEQGNVIMVGSLSDGQEVVSGNGVDGETLLRSGA